eukprot:885249-Amphidinium_carterae.1
MASRWRRCLARSADSVGYALVNARTWWRAWRTQRQYNCCESNMGSGGSGGVRQSERHLSAGICRLDM